MLGSNDREERQEALGLIMKLRKKEARSKRKTVRKVKNPELNLKATKLSELVDLENATSSPPLLFKFSDQELSEFRDVPLKVNMPCTTTAVERGVRLTTEAATMAAGAWTQDTVTWNRVSARERNSLRFKKKDWNC